MDIGGIAVGLVGVFSFVAAFHDWRSFRIPNYLTLSFAALGVVFHLAFAGLPGLVWAVLGFAVGFVLLLVPYLFGGFGGGDVKLLAAAGAWLGPGDIVTVFVFGAILLGGVSLFKLLACAEVRQQGLLNLRLAFVQLTAVHLMLGGDERVEEVLLQEDGKKRVVPFAVVFAVGLCFVIFLGWWSGHGLRVPPLLYSPSTVVP